MAKRSIPSMDLITLKPIGGWESFKTSIELTMKSISFITHQASKRLSSQGHMYFSIFPLREFSSNFDRSLLQDLEMQFANHPTHKLILEVETTSDDKSLYSISGMLLPKNEL